MPGFEQLFFFVLAFTTISALAWSAMMLFERREESLADRLQELQATVDSGTAREQRRRARGGFLNSFLYLVSMIPGMDEYLKDTEKELAQAEQQPRIVAFGQPGTERAADAQAREKDGQND